MRLKYSIKACMPMCILERERKHIGLIWSRITCLDLSFAVAQSLLLEGLEDLRGSQRLNNDDDRKQATQRINKIVYKQYLNTKQTVPIYYTHRYERVSERIT
jgi:hypothetical protein